MEIQAIRIDALRLQTIAAGIAAGVAVHAGLHLTCDFPRVVRAPEEKFGRIADDFRFERPSYAYFLSSAEGVTGVLMVALMAVAFTLASRPFRRSLVKLPRPFRHLSGFNAFWFSHHLFVAVYACLIVDGLLLFFVHKWYQKTVSLSPSFSPSPTLCVPDLLLLLHVRIPVSDVDVPLRAHLDLRRRTSAARLPLRHPRREHIQGTNERTNDVKRNELRWIVRLSFINREFVVVLLARCLAG
jgi:hypothetical protein